MTLESWASHFFAEFWRPYPANQKSGERPQTKLQQRISQIRPSTVFAFAMIACQPMTAIAADFADYPAEIYSGKTTLPDFDGAQKEFAWFKTRLGTAAQRPDPEYAGSWVVEQVGCGSSCTSTYAIDHRTGAIAVLPVGGEEQQNVILYHRPSSNLMKATWFDGFWMDGPCMIGEWVLRDGSFEEISIVKHEPRDDCNH